MCIVSYIAYSLILIYIRVIIWWIIEWKKSIPYYQWSIYNQYDDTLQIYVESVRFETLLVKNLRFSLELLF